MKKQEYPPISPLMAEIKAILDENIRPAYRGVKGKTISAAKIEKLFNRFNIKYPLKWEELQNGECYVTPFEGQGIFIFVKGMNGFYRHDPENNYYYRIRTGNTEGEGGLNPSNGFSVYRLATEEEKLVLSK